MNLKKIMFKKKKKKIMLKKPGTEGICYMIPFTWILEQVKLSDGAGKQNSGCLGGWMELRAEEEEGTFWWKCPISWLAW